MKTKEGILPPAAPSLRLACASGTPGIAAFVRLFGVIIQLDVATELGRLD